VYDRKDKNREPNMKQEDRQKVSSSCVTSADSWEDISDG
jgi:hypothetical protein